MRHRSTVVLCASLVLASTATARAQAPSLPEEILARGTLSVAMNNGYPPLNYSDNETNDFTGVNPDLMPLLAEVLGVEVVFEPASYAQQMPGLNTGRFDFIGSGIMDFPERRDHVTFVNYLRSGPQLFVTADSSLPDEGMTGICGKKIGYARFIPAYIPVLERLGNEVCVKNGLPAPTLVSEDLPIQLGLSQSRYDIGAVTADSVIYLTSTEPEKYKPYGDKFGDWTYGWGFKRDQVQLRDAVAAALDELIADGSYKEALKKYGLESLALEKATVDAGEY